MPVGAWAHRQYWSRSSTNPPPVAQAGAWNYPLWQSVPQSLNTGVDVVYPFRWLWALLRWIVRLVRLSRDQGATLDLVYRSLTSPHYPRALLAVHHTATTLGFNKKAAWARVAGKLKEQPEWAENMWRAAKSAKELDDAVRAEGSTLSNPERTLMVELAYQQRALTPRRRQQYGEEEGR